MTSSTGPFTQHFSPADPGEAAPGRARLGALLVRLAAAAGALTLVAAGVLSGAQTREPGGPVLSPQPPRAAAPAPEPDRIVGIGDADTPAGVSRVVLASPFGPAPLRPTAPVVEKQQVRLEEPPVTGSAGPVRAASRPSSTKTDRPSAGIDLNSASREAIDALGGRLGRAIVAARPYRSVDDLVGRRIITRSAFLQIRDRIVVR